MVAAEDVPVMLRGHPGGRGGVFGMRRRLLSTRAKPRPAAAWVGGRRRLREPSYGLAGTPAAALDGSILRRHGTEPSHEHLVSGAAES
jgi:hypothetical protein